MSLYERLASRVIGTALQRPAEWLRRAKGAPFRRKHPELDELFREDERIERVMRDAIGADTNCIDIGCHVGAYLQRILRLAPRGHHIAFEPVPHKAAWLRAKFPRVTVVEAALDEAEDKKEFFVCPRETALSGLHVGSVAHRETLRVQCRRLDDIVDRSKRVGFIKIDVNGGELAALRGAELLLRRDRPLILLGCTREGLANHGIDADEVLDFVERAGYRIFLLKDHLSGGAPLDAGAFRSSMVYPLQALNYAVVPVRSSDRSEPPL
ncbi:MAG: FkbM family methyltransferase [Rhizobacter sp.]|nr:FkbM family methyltransferase [Rhizobacter sp.]